MYILDGHHALAFDAPKALYLDNNFNAEPGVPEKPPVLAPQTAVQLGEVVGKMIEAQESGPHAAQAHELEMTRVVEGTMRSAALEQQTAALNASRAHLQQITQQAFVPQAAPCTTCTSGQELRADIQQASRAAAAALDGVVCSVVEQMLTEPLASSTASNASTAGAASTALAPQIYRRQDGTFNLIRAVPPVENLVLPGGGAKGVGLAGALLEMEQAGMLSSLRSLAGSSAGALVATWLSVGRGIPELGALLGGKFRELLDTNNALNKVYPDIQFRSTAAVVAKLLTPFGAGHDTATGMIKKLDEVTSAEVRSYLTACDPAELSEKIETFASREAIAKAEKGEIGYDKYEFDDAITQRIAHITNRFAVLQQAADFNQSRQGKMVTFDDMAVLHALAPEKFKAVRITAHDLATRDNVIFSEANAPSLPVAYAARASMAHPLIATGVAFPSHNFKGASHVFSDGGISSNMPVEALVPERAPLVAPKGLPTPAYQRLRAATAVIAFDEEGHATKMMDKSPTTQWNERGIFTRIKDAVVHGVSGWVASNSEMAKDYLADMQKIHNFGPNVLVVQHGDITSLDLDASCKRKGEAILLARTSLQEQLKIVRGDSYAVEVGSVKEAFDLLDDNEKNSLLAAMPAMASDTSSTSTATSASVMTIASPQDQLLALAQAEQMKRSTGRVFMTM